MPDSAIAFIGLLLFGLGILLGLALRGRGRASRERQRELECELASEREQLASYRARVNRHMDQTAHLFRDLTNQHAALYDHLRQGARELAPKPERIGGQAFGPALVEFASAPSTRSDAAPETGPEAAVRSRSAAAAGASVPADPTARSDRHADADRHADVEELAKAEEPETPSVAAEDDAAEVPGPVRPASPTAPRDGAHAAHAST